MDAVPWSLVHLLICNVESTSYRTGSFWVKYLWYLRLTTLLNWKAVDPSYPIIKQPVKYFVEPVTNELSGY